MCRRQRWRRMGEKPKPARAQWHRAPRSVGLKISRHQMRFKCARSTVFLLGFCYAYECRLSLWISRLVFGAKSQPNGFDARLSALSADVRLADSLCQQPDFRLRKCFSQNPAKLSRLSKSCKSESLMHEH